MGQTSTKSSASKTYAVGAKNDTPFDRDTVTIDRTTKWTTTGNGTPNLDAPKQVGIFYNGQTGAVTVDLNAVTDDQGSTINFAKIREIALEVSDKLADGTTAADDAATVIVGAAASTPFVGDWGGTAPTVKVNKGTAKVLHYKPYGTGLSTSSANNLKLDFGAYTLVARLIIKGNV